MFGIRGGILVFLLGCGLVARGAAQEPNEARPPVVTAEWTRLVAVVNEYCVGCHNADDKTAGLALDSLLSVESTRHVVEWEKVVRKLAARQMPPLDSPRPDEPTYTAAIATLVGVLDRESARRPQPGRTDTLRRLNRAEYQNAIRDLLHLEIDATTLLPADESSHGFDNVTVGDLSPVLLDRYITAAEKISQLALGSSRRSPGGDTFRVSADVTQEEHVAGLPLGTRGGVMLPYTFPREGEYEVQVRLARDRNEHVEGLNEPHELQVLLDRRPVGQFTVVPPRVRQDHDAVDQHLQARIAVTAGPHQLGVTFLKNPSSLPETKRQPYQAHFNMHRHPRSSPAVFQVSITGPLNPRGRATPRVVDGSSSAARPNPTMKWPAPNRFWPR